MRISDWSSDVCSSDLPIADAVTCHGGTEDAGSGAGIDSKVRPERITRRGMSRHGQYGCGECGNESSAQERKGCPDRHVALPDVAHGADVAEPRWVWASAPTVGAPGERSADRREGLGWVW